MVFMENTIQRRNEIRMAMARNRAEVRNVGKQNVKSKSNTFLVSVMKGFDSFNRYARRFR